ncbi:MAG: helix-turn-helix transcriptional regulator [Bacillota bacterium]|jgi:transcriptional regulator with XRE-family HTH domain
MSRFAERLRQTRISRGLTQERLASFLGVSRSTVAGYEAPSKEREPDFAFLSKLAEILDVTSDYLLGLSDDPAAGKKRASMAADRPDPLSDLPEEARKSVEDFIEYTKRKYGRKKD